MKKFTRKNPGPKRTFFGEHKPVKKVIYTRKSGDSEKGKEQGRDVDLTPMKDLLRPVLKKKRSRSKSNSTRQPQRQPPRQAVKKPKKRTYYMDSLKRYCTRKQQRNSFFAKTFLENFLMNFNSLKFSGQINKVEPSDIWERKVLLPKIHKGEFCRTNF